MKEIAISIKQPWAYLICAGIKPIENRTWPLPEKYKGERVFIHASGKPDEEPYMLFSDEQIGSIGDNRIMDVVESYKMTSAIIGSVKFVDCSINHMSIWAEETPYYTHGINPKLYQRITGRKIIYNWVAADTILFENPILNVKGKLSFWDCSGIIHSERW